MSSPNTVSEQLIWKGLYHNFICIAILSRYQVQLGNACREALLRLILIQIKQSLRNTHYQVELGNESKTTANLAQATLPDERSRDIGMMSEMVIFLGGIATGVATNALYDGIKEIIARLTKKPQVIYEVHEIQQSNGTKVLQIVVKQAKQ